MLRQLLPRPQTGEGRLRFGMRLLITVLCAAALLQAMRPAVYSTRMGVQTVRNTDPQAPGRVFRQQLEYLSDELARRVPAGTGYGW